MAAAAAGVAAVGHCSGRDCSPHNARIVGQLAGIASIGDCS